MNSRFPLLCFLLLFYFVSDAQFKKGDRMVGMNVGSFFYNSGSADVTFPAVRGYTSISSGYGLRIEPGMGWFLSDKTVVGGSLLINPAGQKTGYEDNGTRFQEDQSSSFNIALGAFARHYFGSSNSFMPFGQFGFNLGISSISTEGYKFVTSTPNYKNTYSGKSSGGVFANSSLQVGLTKMVASYIGLDLSVGYNYSYNTNTVKTVTTTDIGNNGSIDFTSESEPTSKFTNHGFILAVGFQVFLPKKKGN